jgi:hypothetical protein
MDDPDCWYEELCAQAQSNGLWAERDHGDSDHPYGYDNPAYSSGPDYWKNDAGEYCYG